MHAIYDTPRRATQFERPERARTRMPLVLGLLAGLQFVIVVSAVSVRLVTAGWFFVIFVLGGFVVALTPVVAGTVLGLYGIRYGGRRLRMGTAAAWVTLDPALLTFALTMPDFTDNPADTAAPIQILRSGRQEFGEREIDIYSTVAAVSAVVHLLAATSLVVLGIVALWRGNRATARGR